MVLNIWAQDSLCSYGKYANVILTRSRNRTTFIFYIHLSKNTHIQCHSENKTEAEQRCLVWEVRLKVMLGSSRSLCESSSLRAQKNNMTSCGLTQDVTPEAL